MMSWLTTLDDLIAQGSRARMHESALMLDRLLTLPVGDRWHCLRGRDNRLRKLTPQDHEIFCQSLTVHAALAFGGADEPDDLSDELELGPIRPMAPRGGGDAAGGGVGAGQSGGSGDGPVEDGAAFATMEALTALAEAPESRTALSSGRLTLLFLGLVAGGFGVLGGLHYTGIWDRLPIAETRAEVAPPERPAGSQPPLDTIERPVATDPLASPLPIRMVVAASTILELRRAVDAGVPFQRELTAAEDALPAFTNHATIGDLLHRHAGTGIETRAALAARLQAVTAAIRAGRDRTLLAVSTRLFWRATGLSNGAAQRWDLTKQLLQRAETAMAAGKLGAAIAILETLPGGYGADAAAWLAPARTRLAVDNHFESFLGPIPVVAPGATGLSAGGRLG